MTPAERARNIDQLEFERECQQARLRAQQYSEQRRAEERHKLDQWIDAPEPESHSPLNRAQREAQTKRKSGRPAKLYTYNGERKTLTEWAEFAGVSYQTMAQRIRSGMLFDKAVTMHFGQRAELHEINGVSKTLAGWAEYAGIPYETLIVRRHKGRTLAEAIAMSRPLPDPTTGPGVVSNFAPSLGTGAGSTAQEIAEITFPSNEASQ